MSAKYIVGGLIGVLGVASATVIATQLTHTGSTELTVSVLGLAGIVIAALVGLLNAQVAGVSAQTSKLHNQVNGRLDQLVSASTGAAFARGQAQPAGTPDAGPAPTPGVDPATTPPPATG